MSIKINSTFQCDAIKGAQKSDTVALFMCGQCGRRHQPKACPAFGQQCAACHKLHHFARVCRSKKFSMSAKSRVPNFSKKNVFTVGDYSSDTDSLEGENLLVDPLQIDGLAQQVAWLSKLTMPNGDITCKLDTGAEANVLPTAAFNKLAVRPPLQPTKTQLTAYGGSPINSIGTQ